MFKGLGTWLGHPGILLSGTLAYGLMGLVGTLLISPMAAIPLFDLIALLFEPFPTLVTYNVLALSAYLGIRQVLRLLPISQRILEWVSGFFSVGLIYLVGCYLPNSWNSAAGLAPAVPQVRPQPINIPREDSLALIDYGESEYVRCGTLCFSLLLEEKVKFVEVASTQHEPSPLEALPGKQYSLKAETRNCLKGMRDYAFSEGGVERHQEFVKSNSLPIEYDTCLDSREKIVKPEQQVTLVQWVGKYKQIDEPKAGFVGPVSVIRTIVPQAAGLQPVIQEARYRSGYRYITPLYLNTYAGNAASGAYFSLSIATLYFRELGFPDTLEPLFRKSLIGGEDLGLKTASWLDGVVERRAD